MITRQRHNRDINKLRLPGELSPACIADPSTLTNPAFPYWLPADKRVTPLDFLRGNPPENGGSANTAANRLRWMLKDTMGADGAFGRRRQELAILRGCSAEEVGDDDVVESYRDECDPAKPEGNFMLQYLQEGALGCVFGRALFVHGGLDAATVGTVPAAAGKELRVRAWVKKLNAWAQSQIAEFVGDPYSYAQPGLGYAEHGGPAAARMGSALTDYGVSGGNGGATVVYKSFLCNGNGQHLEAGVQDYLLADGVCVGGGVCTCVLGGCTLTYMCTETDIGIHGNLDRSHWAPCSFICMYVCMYVCTYVRTYV